MCVCVYVCVCVCVCDNYSLSMLALIVPVFVYVAQKEMENRMKQHKGKDMGICPVRRELYADCFEELLRQVAIEVPERGHLLAKLVD